MFNAPFFILSIATLLLGNTHASPTPRNEVANLEERQLGESIIIMIAEYFIKGALYAFEPACEAGYADGDVVWYMKGQDTNGLYWVSCWTNDTDTMMWGANEVAVSNCLTNLHYVQGDTCISVAGSSCDLNGYVENGGRVQNMREVSLGPGVSPSAQIDAASSGTLQRAISSLQGYNVRGTGSKGPYFYLTDSSWATFTNTATNMQINWIGEQAC